jgi:hypothetical protein
MSKSTMPVMARLNPWMGRRAGHEAVTFHPSQSGASRPRATSEFAALKLHCPLP